MSSSSSRSAVVGFLLVALNLRIAIASLSPLLGDIQRDEHLSSGAAGLLTTVPVVCFGLFAFLTPRLTRRFGQHRLLGAVMVTLAVGIVIRLMPGIAPLYGGTLVAGASIAVANVLMPALVKRDFAARGSVMTGLYTMALSGGAALAAGLTVPLRTATGWGWRPTLVLWAVPAVVAALAWAPQARGHELPTGPAPASSVRALLRDPVAWSVTGFMGLQSLQYYAFLAWLPTLLQDGGLGVGKAGWMLSYASFTGIVASLATPLLDRRLGGGPVMALLAGLLCLLGYVGLLADPTRLTYLWMTGLGLGQGASISLALGYIGARSPDVHHTGQLSSMAQGLGYLLACLGPFGLGLLHSLDGGWSLPLVVLLVVVVAQSLAGALASRDRHVLAPLRG